MHENINYKWEVLYTKNRFFLLKCVLWTSETIHASSYMQEIVSIYLSKLYDSLLALSVQLLFNN
uniref:Uncharacterized protein n=1 Tax=Arundo donax TaxID=35708 RepID=A0A0A9EK06_ARUDO